MWYHMGLGGMWLGGILFIIILLLIAWIVIRSTSTTQLHPPTVKIKESPLDILKRRYANGEINREQYQQMKSDLS